MIVTVKHPVDLWLIAGILAHDAYDTTDFPKTKTEAWKKVIDYLHSSSVDGVWNDVDDEIEAAAHVRAAELFPELVEQNA